MTSTRTRTRRLSTALGAAIVALASVAGVGSAASPAGAAAPTPTQVVAGGDHVCARMSDGTVRCWGQNDAGQIGDGTLRNRLKAVPVVGLTGVTALSAAGDRTCAIVANRDLYCWGSNFEGALGDGTTTDRPLPTKVTPTGTTVRLVFVSGNHTCAATTDHKLFCWGPNPDGALGLGDTMFRTVPTLVKSLPAAPILAVEGSSLSTCVQLNRAPNTDLFCSGYNNAGMWGTGLVSTSTTTFKPVAKLGTEPHVMASGWYHACRLRSSDGLLRCSGMNGMGQLGNGTVTDSGVMVTVPGAFKTMDTGLYHSCGYATVYNEYRCWGSNHPPGWGPPGGQLGIGTVGGFRTVPSPVFGFSPPATPGQASIGAGHFHTCAIGRDAALVKSVYCWGDDSFGQLGNSALGSSATPTKVVLG